MAKRTNKKNKEKKKENENLEVVNSENNNQEGLNEMIKRVLGDKSDIEIFDTIKHCKDELELIEFLTNYK